MCVLYNALSSHQSTRNCKLQTVQRDKTKAKANGKAKGFEFNIFTCITIQNVVPH